MALASLTLIFIYLSPHQRYEYMCAWCPVMDRFPIQGVFPPHVSWDRLRVYYNPAQDKAITEDDNDLRNKCTYKHCYSLVTEVDVST